MSETKSGDTNFIKALMTLIRSSFAAPEDWRRLNAALEKLGFEPEEGEVQSSWVPRLAEFLEGLMTTLRKPCAGEGADA